MLCQASGWNEFLRPEAAIILKKRLMDKSSKGVAGLHFALQTTGSDGACHPPATIRRLMLSELPDPHLWPLAGTHVIWVTEKQSPSLSSSYGQKLMFVC